ncbi:nucleoside triphosphate pyrophosphohydrolase family protein [Vibrio breoganii]
MKLKKLTRQLFDLMYADIEEFRMLFDLPVAVGIGNAEGSDDLHSSLIVEELSELADSHSIEDMADALIDSCYVLSGRLVEQGCTYETADPGILYFMDILMRVAEVKRIDFYAGWQLVHESNCTKLCDSVEQAEQTIAVYGEKGIKAEYLPRGDAYMVVCSQDSHMHDGKFVKAGKRLKSIGYREVDLSSVCHV